MAFFWALQRGAHTEEDRQHGHGSQRKDGEGRQERYVKKNCAMPKFHCRLLKELPFSINCLLIEN